MTCLIRLSVVGCRLSVNAIKKHVLLQNRQLTADNRQLILMSYIRATLYLLPLRPLEFYMETGKTVQRFFPINVKFDHIREPGTAFYVIYHLLNIVL